ncbi:MAG: glycosyl hydrolase [Candidatus Aminicenantes bacterium]|nr:glycosyl hydrolase [Candidatus Aminicenantes bacterium]
MSSKKKSHKILFSFSLGFLLLLFAGSSFAAEKNILPEYLKALKWRSIGPHRGGRVVAVAGHPTKEKVFYFGGTGSGLWKTTDGGDNWQNISDKFFKTSSVGAVAVSHSSPNVIYVGMGECCLRGNISHGDGVYKSENGGKTWKHMGLADTRHIARIRIHPQNSDVLYVAALGHAFGPHKDRGVYRSLDGGKTWKKVLFRGEKTGAIDLVMEPGNPQTLYAATWEVQRSPYSLNSGGPGSGIFKTGDGGDTWKEISANPGLPEGIKGRIGLTVSAAEPERIWAIIEAKKKGIYRSEDGGANWKLVSSDANMLQRPWYYHHIKADPKDADTLYVMNVRFWKSTDGAKTFTNIRVPHGDNHDLWIDPENPQRMIEANDGGATVTFDGGKKWSSIYNQPTAQFYHVTTDNRFPYRVYGAQQDNSTICVPSRSRRGSITRDEWYHVGGCESGYIAVHPENPDIVYAGCYGGSLTRYDHKTQRRSDISVWPENPMGAGAKDLKYRFQWTFPIFISPHDPQVLYTAANRVFRSTTEGRSWEIISPDLTRDDKSKQEHSGGALTGDNTSVEYYCTIFALAESPLEKGLLWAGSDDGLIHISRDGGKNWQNITPKKLPPWSLVSIIEPSHFDAGTAYIAATRYKSDDYRPYLYKTADFGKTWKKITAGIPGNDFTRVIREDPKHKGLLYVGTETGIYFSPDEGKKWHSLQLNLPVTPIHDLVIHENDIVAGTHGRSFWILDDLTLLYQVLEKKTAEPVLLFKPAATYRFVGWHRPNPKNAGETLPTGAIINYYFKEKPKDPVSLTFLDEAGKVIKTFCQKPEKKKETAVPVKAGLNRFVWDLEYPSSREIPGAVSWGGNSLSPWAIPGLYKVRLKVGKQEFEHNFKLIKDPNYPTTQEEYKQQFDFLIAVRDKLSAAGDTVNEVRSIRKQLKWYTGHTKEQPYFEKIEKAAEDLKKKLQPIEDALIQHKAKAMQDLLNYPIKVNDKLGNLGWGVQMSAGAPNRQSVEVFDYLAVQVDEQVKNLKQIIETDMAAFNGLVKELAVPALILKHAKKDDAAPAKK